MAGKTTMECPECGQPIEKDLNHVEKHIQTHWHVAIKDIPGMKNPEAQARAQALVAFATGGKE